MIDVMATSTSFIRMAFMVVVIIVLLMVGMMVIMMVTTILLSLNGDLMMI